MPVKKKVRKCRDCDYCQACSKSRCRLCRSGKKPKIHASGLARCFTYEEYLQWKLERGHGKGIG